MKSNQFALFAIVLALLVPLSVHAWDNTGHGVAKKLPVPSHIVIVIEENKDFDDVIDSPNAPYINELAGRGALLEKFYAKHHPSQPNYIDFFAGDTLGVCNDDCPIGPFGVKVPNLGNALGDSFAGYAEDLPASGARTTCKDKRFKPKHCPWVDFSNVPQSASRNFKDFPKNVADFKNLPRVSLVIPNMDDDMHNGDDIGPQVKRGDDWLNANLSAYADWAEKNNSLLIITWDEDSDRKYVPCAKGSNTEPTDNHIPTIIVGQFVAPHTKSKTEYTHHDLLRTILDMYGIAPFAGATSATPIKDIWR